MQQTRIQPQITAQQIIDHIQPQLLSAKYHASRLETLAKRPLAGDIYLCWYSDLSDIPLPSPIPQDSMPSAPITLDLMENLGLNLDDLEELGKDHSACVCRPMGDVLHQFCPTEYDDEDADVAPGMMVVTNAASWRGACAILDPRIQQQLDSVYTGGYYVILSSIHETLTVPKDITDTDHMISIIASVNENVVSMEDRLSDEVYEIRDGNLMVVV